MQEQPKKDNTAIIVAIIGGFFTLVVAVVGLGAPVVKNLTDRYIPTFTPIPTNTSLSATQINPIQTETSALLPQATESSAPSALSVDCIHPEQLSAQNGWKDPRLIDKFYGGYNVYVPNPSQLPPLWEANYFGLDNTFSSQIKRNDNNRQMDIGTWIIYMPDECRLPNFHISSDPAPTISSPSEIPNTAMCIHPEQFISQKGWENLGVLDKLDGGYKARILAVDSLPDYWEANRVDENGNLLRQIFYFDQDRRMDVGIWIIYTPPVKSCRDQFGFTIGGK